MTYAALQYESNLGDFQYLYIDLILIFTFSVVSKSHDCHMTVVVLSHDVFSPVGYTGPYQQLVRRRPLGTLAGVHVMVSLCVHTALLLAFQLGALFYLQHQPWSVSMVFYCYHSDLLWFPRYVPLDPNPSSDNILCSENAVVFQISIFQYIALAVFLSTAAPYRKPLYTNGREGGSELLYIFYWDIVYCLSVVPAGSAGAGTSQPLPDSGPCQLVAMVVGCDPDKATPIISVLCCPCGAGTGQFPYCSLA